MQTIVVHTGAAIIPIDNCMVRVYRCRCDATTDAANRARRRYRGSCGRKRTPFVRPNRRLSCVMIMRVRMIVVMMMMPTTTHTVLPPETAAAVAIARAAAVQVPSHNRPIAVILIDG